MKLLTYGLLLLGLLISRPVWAQLDAHGNTYCPIIPMPELPGGGGGRAIVAAVQARLAYPPAALRAQVEGRLFLAFSVTPAGGVREVRVVKSLRPDCDAAAVRAVRQLPRFQPRPARYGSIRYTMPVTFRLAGSRRRIGPPSCHELRQAARRAVLGRNLTP